MFCLQTRGTSCVCHYVGYYIVWWPFLGRQTCCRLAGQHCSLAPGGAARRASLSSAASSMPTRPFASPRLAPAARRAQPRLPQAAGHHPAEAGAHRLERGVARRLHRRCVSHLFFVRRFTGMPRCRCLCRGLAGETARLRLLLPLLVRHACSPAPFNPTAEAKRVLAAAVHTATAQEAAVVESRWVTGW